MSFESSNPILKGFKNLSNWQSGEATMTIEGTATKAAILGVLMAVSFVAVWLALGQAPALGYGVGVAGAILGIILGLIISFFPKTSPYLAPVYALSEGAFLSAISFIVDTHYPGIAVQAAGLTIFTVVTMMVLYRTKMIVVDDTFRTVVFGATAAIAIFYLLGWILSWFHIQVPGYGVSGTWFSIGINFVIVIIAALNLALDFDFIENASGTAPKFYEWYGAFALMVTIVWLYLEILRLLIQLQQRRD